MAHITAIGIATLDLIFTVDHYPHEDEELRAQTLRAVRGGNATNTRVVLSRLGRACAWAGVLADAPHSAVIHDDLQRHRIAVRGVIVPGPPPTSAIVLNPTHGSRTSI